MRAGKSSRIRSATGALLYPVRAGWVLVLPLAFVLSQASGLAAAADWDHEWLKGAVGYEIFVRSFADSDGDGIGDLPGLISRLDYLNDGDPATDRDLGVTVLWLMPVFPSPSYHGYDITDYDGVNPELGTLADFDRLIAEADKRGIRVILDLVLNHTSSQHPWFVDAAASGEQRDWYVWSETDPGWLQPWGGSSRTWHQNPVDGTYYYGLFWSGMPDLNFREQRVKKAAHRLARRWLKRGVGGLRLDAARYLVAEGPGSAQADATATHAFWRGFAKKIRHRFPQAVLVGENWADTATIATYFGSTDAVAGGDELTLNFNFPLAEAIVRSVARGEVGPLRAVLAEMEQRYPAGVTDTPFLTNHDQRRIASQLNGESGRQRAAASLLLTLPGVPFLYYGEEVGMLNGAGERDEAKRTPMPWDDSEGGGFTTGEPWYRFAPGRAIANVAAQIDASNSLLAHYRRLIAARRGSEALAAGRLELPENPSTSVVILRRVSDDERALVAVNLGGRFEVVTVDEPSTYDVPLLASTGAQLSGQPGRWTISLPPFGTGIWRFAPAP